MEIINPASDSTFLLMLEAQNRGYEVFHYTVDKLALEGRTLTAKLSRAALRDDPNDFYTLEDPVRTDMSTMDVILIRQDPPYDMSYITATYLLETIKDKVLIVNDPTSVRDASEKLWALANFPELMPPTIVSKDRQTLIDFINQEQEVILKPLYGNAGSHIIKTTHNDKNLGTFLDMFESLSNEPIMVQKYLSDITKGDKRIILFDGEFAGAVNRVPSDKDNRAALSLGARPDKASLTPQEKIICETIKDKLKEKRLIFVGIDVIGDYLTEINTVSPTGFAQINALNNTKLESQLWDVLEGNLIKTI